MTIPSDPTEARAFVEANLEQIQQFANYLIDNGVCAQLIEAVNRDFFGPSAQINLVSDEATRSPIELVRITVDDIGDINAWEGTITVSLPKLLAGAASLEFLVRHARNVNPLILPADRIPSDEVVQSALVVFHELQAEKV